MIPNVKKSERDGKNMKEYVLVSDATLDLPNDIVEDLGIHVIPMQFTVDEQSYYHYPDERELSMKEFYRMLRDGKMPASSQINPSTYEEEFTPFLKEGKDIIYIALSGGLSGTYQSSVMMSRMLMERYPGSRIHCVDSICASVGEGLLVYQAGCRKRDGYDFDSLVTWIEENKELVEHWFTVEDLFHLKRGGRVSAVSAVVGTALSIKPVLTIDKEGKLYVENKIRGSKKSMDYLIGKLKENGVDTGSQVVLIGNTDNIEAAEQLKDRLMEEELVKDAIICGIGPVIGTHVGPGMLALVFMGKERKQ